ncbi:50S ribosomal protein L11 methyltransferase [Micromonospora sp. CPCC 206060]|uniref:class I SAM-dependent methyltransferase n=1 Tax=Micromonospora sp. CPCC 206060 TaxID=3122406 RepID=UPI002FF26F29
MLALMETLTDAALTDLRGKVSAGDDGLDRIRLVDAPFVPEVRLHLAEDAIVWWARMEAEAGHPLPPPYWASVWAGGQALARYLLDHPDVVAGRRVLDLATGSGLAGIAAALAGAGSVTVNDIDPYAAAAVALNAQANGVHVTCTDGDLLDSVPQTDLLLAGDVFYDAPMAARVLPFLERTAASGATVLVGDPGRGHLPIDRMQVVTSYRVPTTEAFADTPVPRVQVLRLACGPPLPGEIP